METTTSLPQSASSSPYPSRSAGSFTPPSGALEEAFLANERRRLDIQAQLLEARMALIECRAHASTGNCVKVIAVVDGVIEPVLRRIKEERA